MLLRKAFYVIEKFTIIQECFIEIMIKICYVIGTLEIGGAEKQLLKLCANIDKTKFQPTVISLRSGGPLKKEFLKKGIRVIEADKKQKIDIGFFFRLIRILKKEKPDIVHTFMFTANTWGRISAVLCKTPVIFSSERCVDVYKRWYHLLIDRFLLFFTKQVIANSQSVKQFYMQFEHINKRKISVIRNGLNIKKFQNLQLSPDKKKELGLDRAEYIVGAGGRFTEQKGFTYLLKSIPAILREFPECVFVIIGDGSLRKSFEELVMNLHIEKNVVFTGYRNDITEIFSACDLIAAPSLFEGMPNIVMEAMALGKAVVATDIPEMKEVIQDGCTGLLVPVKDTIALSEKIIYLLKNLQVRQEMGQRGYELIRKEFSVDNMVKSYEKLYTG